MELYTEYLNKIMKSYLCLSEFTSSLKKFKLLDMQMSTYPRLIFLTLVLVSNLTYLINSFFDSQ